MSDATWWASLRHGGLLLSPALVARLDAAPLAPLPAATSERLRRAVVRVTADDLPASARTAAQSVEESWAECERHAAKLAGAGPGGPLREPAER